MNAINLVLIIIALLCFLMDCARVTDRINLQSLGLAFYMLALILK